MLRWKKYYIYILIIFIVSIFIHTKVEVSAFFVSNTNKVQNQSKSKVDTELFSDVELEWLYSSKRSQVNTGYPSSITPLNYFYYSSISKGVLMDISTEFYQRTLKGFSSLPITDVAQNKDLINKGVIDILVTGKREEYGNLYYSSPIQEFEYSFFTQPNADIKLVEQLEEQKVGIVNNDDKITSYLNVINDKIEIVEYPNFIDLYTALTEQEIVSIFVPKELMLYQNLNANLSEIKLSDFTVSSWYFASNDEILIRILDKIMTVISTDEFYANHFLKHQNALNSKLYNFDKLTHEWLFYQNPIVKVGIYDIPAFMTYDKDSLSVNGMAGYIFNHLSSQFGIKFEFIYDTYANLLDAYLDGNIELLPVFNYDLSTDITENRLTKQGELYTIYQGEINAYGNYSIPAYDEESKKNLNLDVGTIILPSNIDSEYSFNEMVLLNEKTIGSAVKSLKTGAIDYIFLDPNYLNYFNDYELSPKGKIGKYTFSFLVQGDENLTNFFNAVNKRDFETFSNLENYSNLLATEMYLYELSLLRENIYSMQQQKLFYLAVFLLGTGIIVTLVRQRRNDRKTEHLKYTDHLTGLLNRLGYQREMEKFNKNKSPFTMIILDIDHFKLINDTYGHVVGDFIIEHISKVLKTCCPRDSVLCRLGGDEFVVCVNYSTEIQVVELLEDITEKLLNYQTVEGQELIITASIGVVISIDKNSDLDVLYSHADRALYISKEKGRNQFTFYVED